MLMYRILTALILVPSVIVGIYTLNQNFFDLITAAVVLLMLWEWLMLVNVVRPIQHAAYYLLMLVILLILWFVPSLQQIALYLALFGWCLSILCLRLFPNYLRWWHQYIGIRIAIGIFLMVQMWVGLILIFKSAIGRDLILFLLVTIWSADTGAYFIGSMFGKRKIIPKISPGKSWEGLIGGIIFAVLACMLLMFVSDNLREQWPLYLLLSIAIVFVALIGDLTESLFKRLQGVKDSGKLLPGHGGLLDRLDSLIACAPLFALSLRWMGII